MRNQYKLYFKYLLLFILITINNKAVIAQEFNDEFDKFIKLSLEVIEVIPGLSVVIVKNDSITFINSYGYADFENRIKATVDTPYYIASTTKSFVGMLAQILESEGVIDLDEPITNYRPIKDFNDTTVFKDITIRNLLTHTSGITNGYLVWRNATSGQYTHEKLVQVLEEYSSTLNNNNDFKYDNLGYNIFDLILQEEFDLNWKTLLEQKIFSPLEMDHTTALASKTYSNNWQIAKPYIAIGDKNSPTLVSIEKNDKMMQAAGGLYCSIADVANWLLFNINNGKFKNKTIWSKQIVTKAHTPYIKFKKNGSLFKEVGYGLGWHSALFYNKQVQYHNGGFLGNSARISFMPKYKIGVAIFVNESFFGDNLADLLTDYIYSYFLNEKDSDQPYRDKIKTLKDKIIRFNESYIESSTKKNKIMSKLTLDLHNYEGVYINDGFGEITVTIVENRLVFQMGALKAQSIYSNLNDTLEIEFLGPGSREEIKFLIENDNVEYLNFGGLKFFRKFKK